nr:DUF2065 domain-containing protein [Coralloluteibacterium stylophorae]
MCLVMVIEGLMLFAAPRVWKRAALGMIRTPSRSLRVAGAVSICIGLACLYAVRGWSA